MPKSEVRYTSSPRRHGATRLAAFAAALAIGVAGCASTVDAGADSADERPLVLTTFTVIADMAREVAGDDVRVESITTVGAEIHGYEPIPGDIRRGAGADLILDNGLGLEAWFERFLTQVDAPRVTVSDGVEVIDITEDAAAGQPNPHAWMSPAEAHTYVDNIVAALSELEPSRASAFRERGDAYRSQIGEITDYLHDAIATVPEGQRVLVTCEGAFSYLARDAGLDEAYLWPVNAEQEATGRSIAATIETVREREVPAVFCESTVSDRAMRQVTEATGAAWGGTLYVDSLSAPDGPVPTYLDLLRHDVDLIVAGLTGAQP